MSETYFFDTYAFFEIIRGNPKYEKYAKATAITAIFNLAELNYGLKKETTKATADEITKNYSTFLVEATMQDIIEAMDLKTKNRKLSIPDVVGYIIAKRMNVKFLTGDKGFKNIKNVEFVKK